MGQKKHFSFLFDNNKLLSIGFNDYLATNKFVKSLNYKNKTLHSEVAAIYKFRRDLSYLKGLILVNVRVNFNNTFGISKPCNVCQQWIKLMGFKKIYYTNWNGKWEIL